MRDAGDSFVQREHLIASPRFRVPLVRVPRFLAALIRAASFSDHETRDRVSLRCSPAIFHDIFRPARGTSDQLLSIAAPCICCSSLDFVLHFFFVKTLDEGRVMLVREA